MDAAERRRIRRVAWIIAAACLVPGVLDGWQSYMQGRLYGDNGVAWRQIVFQTGEWVILGALTSIVYAMAVRFPLRGERLGRTLTLHGLGALMLCIGWASSGIALRALLGTLPTDVALPRHAASWLLISLPWSVFLYFAMLGCMFAFSYAFEARERQAQAATLAAQVAEARLDALRMQLHPHFLFNSLNAVAVLVRDGRTTEAAAVIEQLSELLRVVLSEKDVREVPLERELSFMQQYLAIEMLRFSDRLDVRWTIAPDANAALVPVFILQPLIENAIRHGVAARSARTTIEIEANVEGETLRLVVSNDMAEPAARERTRGRGVGLSGTRERLAALYGERANLTTDQSGLRFRAEIRLPIRRGSRGHRDA
jgi:two-component system, LytTR family, sensor kinase